MWVKSLSGVTFFVPINSVEILRALGFWKPKYNLSELQPETKSICYFLFLYQMLVENIKRLSLIM